ncbi:interleukin-8 [Alligator mississippiensis]|uniref:Interleukin-8 n=1 Tax=Alligator mississippiensis TaxID=8496 RepID=A0A151N547_ALLMI|nr:interleukin-8 [Alligator mississippiensis]KYO31954.1 interleukin-8 precursor [Alligator mississippiensis]
MNCKVFLTVLAAFLISVTVTEGMVLPQNRSELRCHCINTHSKFIPPKLIQDVKLIQSGAHCQNVEVIATLQDGREVCLEPTAPWVMRVVKAILEKAESNIETPV